MPASRTTMRWIPECQSSLVMALRTEPCFDTEIIVVIPFKKVFWLSKMGDVEVLERLMDYLLAMRAFPHYMIT